METLKHIYKNGIKMKKKSIRSAQFSPLPEINKNAKKSAKNTESVPKFKILCQNLIFPTTEMGWSGRKRCIFDITRLKILSTFYSLSSTRPGSEW